MCVCMWDSLLYLKPLPLSLPVTTVTFLASALNPPSPCLLHPPLPWLQGLALINWWESRSCLLSANWPSHLSLPASSVTVLFLMATRMVSCQARLPTAISSISPIPLLPGSLVFPPGPTHMRRVPSFSSHCDGISALLSPRGGRTFLFTTCCGGRKVASGVRPGFEFQLDQQLN